MKNLVRRSFILIELGFITLLASCPTTGNHQSDYRQPDIAFPVSKDVYDRTFSEIMQFLNKINEIIKTKNFEAWKANLTREFIAINSDPARLQELSQKPYLKDRNIVLASLYDYFISVFIPSRLETKLDTIDFIDKNRVKAITMVNSVPYVVYLVEKDENNEWKIGVW
jgi:hypothetical protein